MFIEPPEDNVAERSSAFGDAARLQSPFLEQSDAPSRPARDSQVATQAVLLAEHFDEERDAPARCRHTARSILIRRCGLEELRIVNSPENLRDFCAADCESLEICAASRLRTAAVRSAPGFSSAPMAKS
jgi:hypothetical protein